MRARVRRLIAVAAVSVSALVFAFGEGADPQATDAAFTDVEHSASSQLGTVVLQPPVIASTSCQRPTLLNLGQPFLTVQWRWPGTGRPYPNLTAANTQWRINGTIATATHSGPSNGVYTTRFTGNVLQQILGSITDLFGTSFPVTVRTVWTPGTAPWQSAQQKTVQVTLPLLTGIQCPNPDA
ncbi:hypothetical protein [Microbacterium sp. G2-8]|uniref:hypothetical protein n=1 Tax=Microbacterium sp. G2-8 TaxID=2842454 RepID=UPI001C8AF4BB|nr:hypothetical protein [Microbacterium sp. G2-8]